MVKYLVLNKDIGSTELCYQELNYYKEVEKMKWDYVYDENEGRRVRTWINDIFKED
tara:strand:+ start:4210 stop:4377 length:168 start_codon:yes stop_codon:yes gene_type:complete